MSIVREGLPPSPGNVVRKRHSIAATRLDDRSTEIAVGVLGPLEVRRDRESVVIRRGRPRVLLCSLVLHSGGTVSTDVLIDHLWSRQLPAHPDNALQTQIAYLRQALGGAAVAPIVTTPGGYCLDLPPEQIDLHRFEAHRAEGERLETLGTQESVSAAIGEYRAALDLWRGPAFFDVADLDFADIEIIRLDELRLLTHEAMAAALLTLGRASEAVAELGGLVAAHPLRERLQELLMLGLYRTGRQSEALRTYAAARKVLAEELGVEPGLRLKELERQILMQDAGLEWTPPPGLVSASTDRTRVSVPEPGPATGQPAAHPFTSSTESSAGFELIGREQELGRVSSLLSRCRVLTLTGPGGAGKTRLAQAVASSWAGGRAVIVDLAGATEATVAATLLTGLGAGAGMEKDPVSAIGSILGEDACLLVLDTCERVVSGLAPIVEALVASRSNVTILATSRRPLNLAGEIAWPIPPLVVPTHDSNPELAPAFELFVRRAREVKPDLELTDADVSTIAELCRTLEGLPLAIELAAAQMDVLAPATIQGHLEGVSLPASSIRPERQRTMRATTEWSIGLLNDSERELLYTLSVLAPKFDLDAVLAVSDHGHERTVEEFVTLVRTSLVGHDGADRYRLPDTVRMRSQAGCEQLETLTAARRSHAEHYAALASRAFEEVRTPCQGPWMERLDADLANIRTAIDWCFGVDGDEQLGARLVGDIAWVWALQGNLVDARRVLERASAVESPPAVRARVLLGVGLVAAPLGDHERVRQVCCESAEISRSLHDQRAVADALLSLGVAEWASGDMSAAAAAHDEAMSLFDAVGERWGATVCRILRSRTARDVGEFDVMEALLDIAVDDAKRTGDQHVIGLAYEQSAWLCLAREDLESAQVWAEACLHSNETLGYPEGICAAHSLLGRIQVARGEAESARVSYLRVLSLASAIAHLGAMCSALEGIAEVDALSGELRRAALILLHVERARRKLPLPELEAKRIGDLSNCLKSELGSTWGDIETVARLGSLESLVSSLLSAD